MKPYTDHIKNENNTGNPLKHDATTDLNEGLLRSVSAIALVNKIRKLKGQIKSAKTTDLKLELLADQNLTLGMLMFART
jgi:hypothetical protein